MKWRGAELGLVTALCVFGLSACQNGPDQADRREDRSAAREKSTPMHSFTQRFREARADPRLIRGNVIPDAEVNCKTGQIFNRPANRALIFRPVGPEGGSFIFYIGDHNMMLGKAEFLAGDDERIFVLSGLRVGAGSFERDELQAMADLIETHENTCTGGRIAHISAFVLLEGEWPREKA